jgi:hypothetical protein
MELQRGQGSRDSGRGESRATPRDLGVGIVTRSRRNAAEQKAAEEEVNMATEVPVNADTDTENFITEGQVEEEENPSSEERFQEGNEGSDEDTEKYLTFTDTMSLVQMRDESYQHEGELATLQNAESVAAISMAYLSESSSEELFGRLIGDDVERAFNGASEEVKAEVKFHFDGKEEVDKDKYGLQDALRLIYFSTPEGRSLLMAYLKGTCDILRI